MIFRSLGHCLRTAFPAPPFDPAIAEALAALDGIPGTRELVRHADAAEQARFEAECARELCGDFD